MRFIQAVFQRLGFTGVSNVALNLEPETNSFADEEVAEINKLHWPPSCCDRNCFAISLVT